jgi:hypothetical protein
MRHAVSAFGLFAVLAVAMATSAAQDPTDAEVVAAIETRASVMVEQGARSEAVPFLQTELAAYRGAPIQDQIQSLVDRMSLEGRPAPRLETRLRVGPRCGRPAAPDKELRYIIQVRDTHYGFLRNEPVPVSEANYKEYGVTTVPMHVLVDRQGVIRLYQPGRMTEEELEAAIKKLL